MFANTPINTLQMTITQYLIETDPIWAEILKD